MCFPEIQVEHNIFRRRARGPVGANAQPMLACAASSALRKVLLPGKRKTWPCWTAPLVPCRRARRSVARTCPLHLHFAYRTLGAVACFGSMHCCGSRWSQIWCACHRAALARSDQPMQLSLRLAADVVASCKDCCSDSEREAGNVPTVERTKVSQHFMHFETMGACGTRSLYRRCSTQLSSADSSWRQRVLSTSGTW